MARVQILDPTAPPPNASPEPGPAAGSLAGQLVGIRHDPTWRSFAWVMDEWAELFRAAGARVRTWSVGSRSGDAGVETARELEGFASDVDLAVVGLGN